MPGQLTPKAHGIHRRAMSDMGDDALLEPSELEDGRYAHIDVTRICCIVLVVFSVFDARYAMVNTICAWQWVLPLLWLLCGICYGLSERTILDYSGRLLKYFAIGFFVNLTAWILQGWVWQNSVWEVPVQMMFVFNLMVVTLLLAPVKLYCFKPRQEGQETLPITASFQTQEGKVEGRDRRDELLRALMFVGAGIAAILVLGQKVLRPLLIKLAEAISTSSVHLDIKVLASADAASVFGSNLAKQLQVCLVSLWIVAVCPQLFDKSLTSWILLAHFYVHRAAAGLWKPELFCNSFCLVLIAMVACRLGMAKRRQVGTALFRYWYVLAVACGLLWRPGFPGSGGTETLKAVGIGIDFEDERARMIKDHVIEAMLVILWLTAGQYMVDPKIFSEDGLSWLNEWALLAFLLNTAFQLILAWPLDWVALLALGPVCWVLNFRLSSG
eukprot:TRINITY_DN51033_c0_g1_i1.p1 TRINITY_DN51033_c0_g1~~TRINITY_DN51033_c0_g1_i1.p1  ORF type:complete len:442 (+),score=48.79 TRINITY_DN51033_c0_g1_i1:149-1474(+)